jgi:hypothetical protein
MHLGWPTTHGPLIEDAAGRSSVNCMSCRPTWPTRVDVAATEEQHPLAVGGSVSGRAMTKIRSHVSVNSDVQSVSASKENQLRCCSAWIL